MALGRRIQEQQPSFWIAVGELPRSEGHVFYRKLNHLLREAGFDEFVESLCEPYYHDTLGRPGIPPGVYFRMLLVGYFEGLGSQRGIAWRCADSLSLREFLGIRLGEETPDVLLPVLARVASHDALHGRVGLERRGVDAHRLAFQQALGVGHLQHEAEHLLMNRKRQSVADPRQARMVGRVLGERDPQKLTQAEAIGTPPSDAPL